MESHVNKFAGSKLIRAAYEVFGCERRLNKIRLHVYIDNFLLVVAVQVLNRSQWFSSPGVGDTNTDQQRRKRCENSNLENGL